MGTRRNQFILTLALGFGLGVAMEGHVIDYPGPKSFYRKVLAFDYGFWPMKSVCGKFLTTTNSSGFVLATHDTHCPNYNGPCCAEWDKSKKMVRAMFINILKTPYGIGFVIAFILNLILPEDKVVEAETDAPAKTVPASSSSTSSSSSAAEA